MSLILLNIKGISYSQSQNGAYVLVLSEVGGNKTLPIVIGAFEAQAIAISLQSSINPPRPITHDLFKNLADSFEINIKKVVIHKLEKGIFYSSIYFQKDDVEKIIDARTSDAIAIATRLNAPVFTYKSILDTAGIYMARKSIANNTNLNESSSVYKQHEPDTTSSKFEEFSIEELQHQLQNALENEDYETAAKIRDEMAGRS